MMHSAGFFFIRLKSWAYSIAAGMRISGCGAAFSGRFPSSLKRLAAACRQRHETISFSHDALFQGSAGRSEIKAKTRLDNAGLSPA